MRLPIPVLLVVLLIGGVLGCVLPGCGPVLSSYLIVNAQAELDGAKAAEAEKYAIYEYTAAAEYLHKAREEQGYADFGPSIDFAYKAGELARQGKERADKEKQNLEAPGEAPLSTTTTVDETARPRVIIKRTPDSGDDGEKVKVEIVPINPAPPPKKP